MKTKQRKRLLVSSVAMLLVAMVALGTATFAWFTTNTSATASDINVQTTKSSELKVAKSDLDFQDSISYGMKTVKTLRPVTSADGNNWYSAVAASKSEYKSDNRYTPQTSLENYAFVEMLNVKNAGGSDCKNVTISVQATVNSGFARVAIIPCETAQQTANSMPATTKEQFAGNIYGAVAGDSWTPYNGTALEEKAYTTQGAINGKTITIEKMEPDEVKSYKIMVWFEGEDADCFDTTVSGLAVPKISFDITGSSD